MTLNREVEVLVVGGGPVGHATALQLGRQGVQTLVVERRKGLSVHPKALGAHPRTMELYRRWGVADAVLDRGLPPADALGFVWVTRVTGLELGKIMIVDDVERLHEYATQTDERMCMVPQDQIEQVLAAAVGEQRDVEVRFDTEAVALEQDGDGVTVTLRPRAGGEAYAVRARYVIAADGVRSPTRRLLGITETADPPYGESVNVYFESAGLGTHTRGRPFVLWWIVNDRSYGTFWPMGRQHRWIYNFEGDTSLPDEHFDEALCVRRIRDAVGDPQLDVAVIDVLRWAHERAVADEWRRGRVFLVGDAAHRFPPHGGFGLNSGVQDSANLVWKLAAVLRGEAGEDLLDSYEAERRPVAVFNAEQTTVNTKRMTETGWLSGDRLDLADIEEPAGRALREQIAAAVPKQRDQLHSQGQQFGMIYESSAVVPDGREPVRSTITEYRMTSSPGARVPQARFVTAAGERVSTIGLLDDGFLLLAGPDGAGWTAAAAEVAERFGVALTARRVAPDGDLSLPDGQRFEEVFEVSAAGAVLVRPDAHVAFRSAGGTDDPAGALEAALGRILSRPARVPMTGAASAGR